MLKQQQGKFAWCGLYFREQDVMEVDHKTPLSTGGKDEWVNLQLLYRHCHDEKTAVDGSQTGRESYGNGVLIVVVGVTAYQGERENRLQGKVEQLD